MATTAKCKRPDVELSVKECRYLDCQKHGECRGLTKGTPIVRPHGREPSPLRSEQGASAAPATKKKARGG